MELLTPTRITIHCSDTDNGKPVSIATIDAWHKKRGFKGIGYHYVIGVDGTVERGRPDLETGAHVKGENKGNIGICLIGRDRYSQDQFYSLLRVYRNLRDFYGIKEWDVYCHYEFPSALNLKKTCPNIRASMICAFLFTGNLEIMRPYLLDG